MSIELAKEHLKKFNYENKIIEFSENTATVELAAIAVGCEPKQIAKTMSFDVNGKTILVLLAFLLVSSFNSLISNEAVRAIFDWFSLYTRYVQFTYGIFDISALLYYISLAGVFVFLTTRVFEARRYN